MATIEEITLDNRTFKPIYDEIDEISEISYLKKYNNIFNKLLSPFVNSELVKNEIERDFNEKMLKVKDGKFKETRINSLQRKKPENFETATCLEELVKKSHKRKSIKSYEHGFADANNNQKVKSLTDFDRDNCNSIKSLAVKKTNVKKVTGRFVNGKMRAFSKISLASFIYDIIDIFSFPDEQTRDTFSKLNK